MDDNEQQMFLHRLASLPILGYSYTEENLRFSPHFQNMSADKRPLFEKLALQAIKAYKTSFVRQGMNLGRVIHYNFSDLENLTGNFSDEKLIQNTCCGRLFRAKISDSSGDREVTIKTWDLFLPYKSFYGWYPDKLCNELVLLSHGEVKSNPRTVLHKMVDALKSHKNLPKVIGYSCDKYLAVVYDLPSLRCVHYAISCDDFDWNDRMRLALEIGYLVQLMHDNKLALGSIDTKNIMIDKEGNFKLFEIGLHVCFGGTPTQFIKDYFLESVACFDPVFYKGTGEGFTIKSDTFAYGILLLELMTKQVYESNENWCFDVLSPRKDTLVDVSFNVDEVIGSEIANLAVSCLHDKPAQRPEMSEIVGLLEKYYAHLLDPATMKQEKNGD